MRCRRARRSSRVSAVQSRDGTRRRSCRPARGLRGRPARRSCSTPRRRSAGCRSTPACTPTRCRRLQVAADAARHRVHDGPGGAARRPRPAERRLVRGRGSLGEPLRLAAAARRRRAPPRRLPRLAQLGRRRPGARADRLDRAGGAARALRRAGQPLPRGRRPRACGLGDRLGRGRRDVADADARGRASPVRCAPAGCGSRSTSARTRPTSIAPPRSCAAISAPEPRVASTAARRGGEARTPSTGGKRR